MKFSIKNSLSFLLTAALLFSFIGCSSTPKPDSTVSGFFDAIKQGDINSAAKFVKSDSKGMIFYEDVYKQMISKAVYSKLNYRIESSQIKGNTATVKAKVTSVDLVKITSTMVTDLLPKMMSQTLNEGENSELDAEKLVEQYFIENINDPSTPKITTDVTIKLIKAKDKKSWQIEPTESLINAITGNLQNAYN